MNNSEQIKDVFGKLEALKKNIDELKYFNRILIYRLRKYLIFKVKTKKHL